MKRTFTPPTTAIRKSLLAALLVLIAPFTAWAESIPVAKLTDNGDDTYTLTFTYADESEATATTDGTPGTYSLNRHGWTYGDSRTKTTTVVFADDFASARPTSTSYWFSGLSKLTTITGINNLNTEEVEYMSEMFRDCSSLTFLDLSSLKTEKVTDMRDMFRGCSALTTLNLSGWDTGNVTDMEYMFFECNALTTIDAGSFNTSKVTDMQSMFYNCKAATTINVSSFDTQNVTSMAYMFSGCKAVAKLEVGSWNTANVTSMVDMFRGCSAVAKLDVDSWNTANVTDMERMFKSCWSLTSLDISGWDMTNVTNAYEFASLTYALRALNVGDNDLKNISQTAYAFEGAGGSTNPTRIALTVGSGFDTSVLGDKQSDGSYKWLEGYFILAEADGTIPVAILSGDDTKTLTFTYAAATDATANGGENGTYSIVAGNKWLNNGSADKITTVVFTDGFAKARPVSMRSWFYNCKNLATITDIGNLNTSEVTDMYFVFGRCRALTTLDLSGWNTEKVTDIRYFLDGCQGLQTLNIGNNDLSGITNKDYAFDSVGSASNPVSLIVGNGFNKEVLGNLVRDSYYNWLDGYFILVDPTDIAPVIVDGQAANAPRYNLQGQRVGDSYRGVVIQNGRKTIRR